MAELGISGAHMRQKLMTSSNCDITSVYKLLERDETTDRVNTIIQKSSRVRTVSIDCIPDINDINRSSPRERRMTPSASIPNVRRRIGSMDGDPKGSKLFSPSLLLE